MKYRLTNENGLEIEVPESVWEALLELAYRNGWRPSGTEPPGSRTVGPLHARTCPTAGRSWASSDYFSASSQYVGAEDARQLGCAALTGRTNGEAGLAETSQGAAMLRVARFALHGGFEIGPAPERGAPA